MRTAKTPLREKANFCILCDDLRKEENGKLLLIGVYTEDVVVPAFPTVLRQLCFFCRFGILGRAARIEIGIRDAFGKPIVPLMLTPLESTPRKKLSFGIFTLGPIVFSKAGEYVFALRNTASGKEMFRHTFQVQLSSAISSRRDKKSPLSKV